MQPPKLADTQHYLWRLITAPEGVAAGLAAMDDADPALAARLGEIVAADTRLTAVQRLDVYANMYFFRLLDSIREDYPGVVAAVGEEEFHNLITDYLLAHPSSHWSLRYAGQHLPAFLRLHRLAGERAWLADLATLEWAILDAFDAADAPALEASALANLGADDWAVVGFTPSPSLRLLDLEWKVDEVWDRTQQGEAAGDAEPGPSAMRVWRRDLRVFHQPIDPLERDCLRLLLDGAPFSAWCEHAAEVVGDEEAAPRVVAILQTWLAAGVLAGTTCVATTIPLR